MRPLLVTERTFVIPAGLFRILTSLDWPPLHRRVEGSMANPDVEVSHYSMSVAPFDRALGPMPNLANAAQAPLRAVSNCAESVGLRSLVIECTQDRISRVKNRDWRSCLKPSTTNVQAQQLTDISVHLLTWRTRSRRCYALRHNRPFPHLPK